MKESFDVNLLSSGEFMKRSYSFLIANMSKAVAIITLIIATIVSFAEVGFSNLSAERFTSTLITMLIASYIMYFSLEDAGEKLGRDTEEYKHSLKNYLDKKSKISGEDINALRQFCLDYRNEELEYRRNNTLFSLGYTKEEYAAYRRGECKSKKMCREMRRVERLKRANLSAADLLSKSNKKYSSELKNPQTYKLLNLFIRIIPSTVCMIFTISLMISTRENQTFASVIESLVKLCALPIIGLKGYNVGYEYATEAEAGWLETKTSLLDCFIKRKEK